MADRKWTQEEIDEDMFGEYDGPPCPRCDGHRTVACHCGGDLCVCLNYGEKDCPLCYGEGVADPKRAEKYLENQREFAAAMRKWLKENPHG